MTAKKEVSPPPTPPSTVLPTTLVSFRDGSYKKIKFTAWKHSQWIHFTRPNGAQVHVNPANVNYMEDV